MNMSSQDSDVIVDTTAVEEWSKRLADTRGQFDEALLRAHYNQFGAHDGPFTSSQFIGIREWFRTHMRALRMKESNATTNLTRYEWLCQHYFVEERSSANPMNYHQFPFGKFYTYPRFYKHFFSSIFSLFDNKFVQFILAMILMYQLHYWSHALYMVPMEVFKMHYPCAEVPTQPLCEILTFVQQNTFEGIHDMHKTLVTLFTTMFVSKVMSMARFRG